MRHSHPAFRIALIAAVGVALPAFSPARAMIPAPAPVAQSAQPDSFGYRWIDNQGPDNPASGGNGPNFTALWEDITSLGSQAFGANVDDSVSGLLSMGFTFNFYGTDYTQVYITSNSNIHFANPTGSLSNTTIPSTGSPNAMISIFWDDTHTRSGQIRYYLAGTAPNRRFIVHWINTGHFSSASDVYNYQIKLYEDGRIFMLYQSMSGTYASGSSASIGIENAAGTVGLAYHVNGQPSTTSIAAGRAIQFANNIAPFDPTNLHQTGTAGGAARPVGYVSDSTIFFRATVSDPDSSNTLGVQAEILPSSQPFTTNPSGTLVQTAGPNFVNDGEVAEAALDFSLVGLPSGNYHWRLRTLDNSGASSNWVVFDAATIHFTTDFAPPTVPSGPFSPDGVQLIFLAPTGDVPFSWGPSTDAGPPGPIGYRLEISLSSGFNATLYDSVLTSQDATVNLTASDTPYYWRVSAVDQAGNQSAPSVPAVFQLSWTAPFAEGEDRHANCGATTGGGSPFTLCLAVAAALSGLLLMRRPAA